MMAARRFMRFGSAGVLGALAVLAASCGGKGREEASGKVRVFVSIEPQACFAERVGGAHVEVHVLVPPGQSPETYDPTPQQLAGLAEAQVYFRIGVPFERALARKIQATMKGLEIVDTREGITLLPMAEGHAHEEPGEEGQRDPHIWLDPMLVKVQAATMARALAKLDPAHAADYEKNVAAFDADLDAANARIGAELAPLKGRQFFVFHPAFGYFAHAYGLKQVAVEEEGKAPSARQLGALIEKAKKEGAKTIFVEPQFSQRSAEAIAQAIGGDVVPLDPLARDYIANLEQMAAAIKKALEARP